jgi:hypothetical protein
LRILPGDEQEDLDDARLGGHDARPLRGETAGAVNEPAGVVFAQDEVLPGFTLPLAERFGDE